MTSKKLCISFTEYDKSYNDKDNPEFYTLGLNPFTSKKIYIDELHTLTDIDKPLVVWYRVKENLYYLIKYKNGNPSSDDPRVYKSINDLKDSKLSDYSKDSKSIISKSEQVSGDEMKCTSILSELDTISIKHNLAVSVDVNGKCEIKGVINKNITLQEAYKINVNCLIGYIFTIKDILSSDDKGKVGSSDDKGEINAGKEYELFSNFYPIHWSNPQSMTYLCKKGDINFANYCVALNFSTGEFNEDLSDDEEDRKDIKDNDTENHDRRDTENKGKSLIFYINSFGCVG